MSGWIITDAGVRVPIADRGVLIGRSVSCAIVVDEPGISRRHALVLLVGDTTQIVPLGGGGVVVADETHHEAVEVPPGSRVRIGGLGFTIARDVPLAVVNWVIAIGSSRHPILGPTFSLGGATDDDLLVDGLPPHACIFHPTRRALAIELETPLLVDGLAHDRSEVVLHADATIEIAGRAFHVVRVGDTNVETLSEPFPSAVTLEFVPNGVVTRLNLDGADTTVFMPQVRGDLVVALLCPPEPNKRGDWVPDDVLVHRIWGRDGGTRQQLNLVIHRTRRSLSEAGLLGPALIERAPGGKATRFRLRAGARVTMV